MEKMVELALKNNVLEEQIQQLQEEIIKNDLEIESNKQEIKKYHDLFVENSS